MLNYFIFLNCETYREACILDFSDYWECVCVTKFLTLCFVIECSCLVQVKYLVSGAAAVKRFVLFDLEYNTQLMECSALVLAGSLSYNFCKTVTVSIPWVSFKKWFAFFWLTVFWFCFVICGFFDTWIQYSK